MSADIVERLNDGCLLHPKRWSGDTHDDLGGSIREDATDELMREAAAEIVRLRGEVAERADDLTTAYMAGRFDGKAIAPAEAKGDDTLLECTCHYLPFRDCPHIPHRTESQPAGGEAVVPLREVLAFIDCIAVDGKGLRHTYVESRSGSMVRVPEFSIVYTAPPAAQVQQEAAGVVVARTWVEGAPRKVSLTEYGKALPDGTKLYTHPTGDALGAVRELVEKWRRTANIDALHVGKIEAGFLVKRMRICADELEAALRPSAGEGKGVSATHKKHDGPCWRNSHADCGC